ncbi:MAG: urate hydroxylase PuuD, partial [Candidatus Competibacteraceae bacterium]|nr:urate hydroxylase PuuD [Candidatus Competibacteraceae bacterium]
MAAYLIDWLSLAARWLHLITGIAWIGASFYFVWLDNHLLPPRDPKDSARGIGGEVWSVHGGGFYQAQKFKVAPAFLPEPLHWFKWEAYWTWMSGTFLLALIYWYGAEIYLIDPTVAALSKPVAIAIGVGTLVLGWLVYDVLCKSRLGQNDRLLGVAVCLFTVLVAYGLCQVFSGRGAFIHYGAMLGTIMVANVFFVIMPGQRELVSATEAGRSPDPTPGLKAKQRSVHNTYFTLPVLFVMISNHYAMTYGHAYNWLILLAISLIGALIRVYFVARHKGPASPWPLLAAALLTLALVAALAPRTTPDTGQDTG